jgi:uncharacterized membrane protein YkoI
MKRVLGFVASLTLATAGFATAQTTPTATAAHPIKGAEFASTAKITLARARAIALKARPGDITDQELEKERGGSGLRYSFDIKSGGKVHEVGVDAKSGRVLENKAEGPNPD